jgi:hypothetical protein
MSAHIWQVFVSGYVLVEANSENAAALVAQRRFNDSPCPELHYEVTDDVTESPRFARHIENGDVLR